MAEWSFFFQRGIWIGSVLIWVSLITLGLLIFNVVKLVRKSTILRVPVAALQEVQFPDAGRVVLSMEGPRFTKEFAGLKIELHTDYGAAVKGRPVLLRTVSSGVRNVRMELCVFDVPHPGRYVLRAEGLRASLEEVPDHRFLLARPHLFQVVGYVVGMIMTGALLILGILLIVWRASGKPGF